MFLTYARASKNILQHLYNNYIYYIMRAYISVLVVKNYVYMQIVKN